MTLNEKENLKLKLEEIEKKETECYEWARVLERMGRVGLLEKPKGTFFKKCPRCEKKLNHKEMFGYYYYECSCGYEYARVSAIG